MKCPHCLAHFHETKYQNSLDKHSGEGHAIDKSGRWYAEWYICPACNNITIDLMTISVPDVSKRRTLRVYPAGMGRAPLPPEIPDVYANEFRESSIVLGFSPKASAALSRRCLQLLIHEHFKITKHNLFDEIGELMQSLPQYLKDAIDGVRIVGNFAAHPMKSTNTGEIHDVQPHEAEWNLDTLEQLFDHCFVQPAKLQKNRDTLNTKLADAGQKPMR